MPPADSGHRLIGWLPPSELSGEGRGVDGRRSSAAACGVCCACSDNYSRRPAPAGRAWRPTEAFDRLQAGAWRGATPAGADGARRAPAGTSAAARGSAAVPCCCKTAGGGLTGEIARTRRGGAVIVGAAIRLHGYLWSLRHSRHREDQHALLLPGAPMSASRETGSQPRGCAEHPIKSEESVGAWALSHTRRREEENTDIYIVQATRWCNTLRPQRPG